MVEKFLYLLRIILPTDPAFLPRIEGFLRFAPK